MAKHGDNVEQAVIQADGTFRMMGLQPEITYIFVVESPMVERTLPGSQKVMIVTPSLASPNSDVTDLRFTSIEKQSTTSISGSAFFESEET